MSLAETVNGWYDEAEQKGLKRGREEGREEGRKEGRKEGREESRTLLLKLLELKFGAVSNETVDRVKQLSSEQLMHCAEKILTAESLEAVFTD